MKVNFQIHAPNTLVPRREHNGTHRIGYWMRPTVLMDTAIKRGSLALGGIKPQSSNP
jgi:hypothetical protein